MEKKRKKASFVKRKVVESISADYIILLGQRSNGKSFCVKESVLIDAYKNDNEFGYLRRYDEDTKDYMITEYFGDFIPDKLLEITNGEFDTISVYRKAIYFSCTNPETGKIERMKKIGNVFSLATYERYKSRMFPNITTLIFEEFITDNYYLQNEPKKLFNLVSSIARLRKIKVYCIGNTISRICPYFNDWQLVNIPRQKIGTIELYHVTDTDTDTTVTIGVYLTDAMKVNSGMFFGNSAKSIVSGMWETDEHPHLFGHKDEYNIIYTLVFMYDKNMFLCEFLQSKKDSSNYTWFISPKNTPIQKNTRIVSNNYIFNALATIGFKALTDNEQILFNYLKAGKVCYSDNLTGTEFQQCYKMI